MLPGSFEGRSPGKIPAARSARAGCGSFFSTLLSIGASLLAAGAVFANGHAFIGAERCKLCHRDIYYSWIATPHARTSIREASAERCLTCHATGAAKLKGVQCEACHGAGSDYSAPEVMIDPEKAAMAGLVKLSIGICESCHENDEPGHRGELAMPPKTEWGLWVHELQDRE